MGHRPAALLAASTTERQRERMLGAELLHGRAQFQFRLSGSGGVDAPDDERRRAPTDDGPTHELACLRST